MDGGKQKILLLEFQHAVKMSIYEYLDKLNATARERYKKIAILGK